MPTCIICLEVLKDPAALPCGHVFCYSCIVKIVRSITPYTTRHFCPTCRHPYIVSHIDPNLVPHHLQPHVSPAVRRLHLECSTLNTPTATTAAESSASECDRLRAEVASLKACSIVWRKRAAVHAAATLGVIGLARMARDTAMKMKSDRDDMEVKYLTLQKKYEESQRAAPTQVSPPTLPKFCEVFCATPLPLSNGDSRAASRTSFRMPSPSPSEESYCSDCIECSHGSTKRKRDDHEEDALFKRTRSNSSGSSPPPQFAKLVLAESFERKPLICPDACA